MWRIVFIRPVMMDADIWMTTPPDTENPNPNWVLDSKYLRVDNEMMSPLPTLNDLCTCGISPTHFRLIRQGNSQILKRLDGRVWSTLAVPRLIEGAMALTNGVKYYKLTHTTRAPWEATNEHVVEDLTLYVNQQKYETNGKLLDDFSLSYSYYKIPIKTK
jgi:hypothetical protein